MSERILITGAAGNVGQHVVRCLARRGVEVIAATRSGDPTLEGVAGSTRLDFLDRGTWASSLAGARRMFLMRPPAIADVDNTLNPFIDFSREQGVEHVVFLSVAGAGENPFVPHRKVEQHLRALGPRHTNLRPGFFAQNLESAYRRDIIEDNRIYVPAGRKQPVNWIDARDIAEVAASVLEQPADHEGKDYTLAGPGPVEWSRVVAELSEALGRTIRYEPASALGYVLHLRRRGLPVGAVAVQTVLHLLLRFGQGATQDPTMAELLGRPGRTIAEYIHDHAHLWRAEFDDAHASARDERDASP